LDDNVIIWSNFWTIVRK